MHDAPLLGHAIEVHENTDAISGLLAWCRRLGLRGGDGSEPLREMTGGVGVVASLADVGDIGRLLPGGSSDDEPQGSPTKPVR